MHRKPTGLILCGGNGERLGGIDKPLRELGAQPLVQHVIERLLPQISRIVISANRNLERYSALGFVVVDDGAYAGCGPLGGMLAGLAADDDNLLCVPGDAPAIPADLGNRLASARGEAAIAYAHDSRGPQPLCCLLRAGLHDDLRAYLDGGGRTPREWFARHQSVAVDFSEAPPWVWSINTPAEWTFAEAQLEAAPSPRINPS